MTSSTRKSEARWPQAVLFDHDGTLVSSESLHAVAWEKLFTEIGLPYNPDQHALMVGKTAPQILRSILNQARPDWKETDFDLNQLALRKNDHFLAAASTQLRPYPGVAEGLAQLRARGIACAVVSNARRRELVSGLQAAGIHDFFSCILSRDDVPVPKPDPGPFLQAAAELGRAPEECVVVEDSPTGLEAALMGKIPAAAIQSNFDARILSQPVPGRPDLKPWMIFPTIQDFFNQILRERS